LHGGAIPHAASAFLFSSYKLWHDSSPGRVDDPATWQEFFLAVYHQNAIGLFYQIKLAASD
ncbi:MAG: hypothetical protein ACLRWH_06930, partial [Emergencia sp.]